VKILIGYSTSSETLQAFANRGHDVWTCDLLPAEHKNHLQCDIWEVANDSWDLGIFHPMCTYLTTSAAWAFADPDFERYPGVGYHQRVSAETLVGEARRIARSEAIDNFKRLDALPYPHAIENPAKTFISTLYKRYTQVIQPYEFGDDASKATGLWLHKLPKLTPTVRVPGRIVQYGGKSVERWANQTDSGQNRISPSKNRWLVRSKTYPGIAAAMGAQWG
jgi:hypothetical protein